jgi:hypothetical protein
VLAPPAHANYASAESSIYAGKVQYARSDQCRLCVVMIVPFICTPIRILCDFFSLIVVFVFLLAPYRLKLIFECNFFYNACTSFIMCNQVKFLRHEQCMRAVEVCHALAHRCVEPAFAGVAEIEWDAHAHADDTDLLIVDEFAWDRQAAAVCQEDTAAAAARAGQGKKAAPAPAPAATASASAPADDSTRLLRDMIRLRYVVI